MKILSKAIVVLMIVFSLFYKSNVSAAYSWELQTGNMIILTSNTSNAGVIPYLNYSTTGESLTTFSDNAYLTFDNDNLTMSNYTIVTRVYAKITWETPVKLKTVTSSIFRSNIRKLYGIKEDNTLILIDTKSNSNADITYNDTWNITDNNEYIGIAIDCYESGYPGRWHKIYEIQITEWYEYVDDEVPVDPDPEDPTPVDYTEVLLMLESIDQNIKNNGSLTLSLVTLVSLFGLTILNIRWFGGWKK